MSMAANPRNTSTTPPGPRGWRRIILAGWSAAAVVVILLVAYFALAVTSVLNKSVTYDEPVHLAGGYVYWTRGDYRINPENGILPQRVFGLPPLLIQVGEHEIIRDDSVRVAAQARADGVDVTLEVWEGMFHVFQSHEPLLPEAREAVEHIASFMRSG